jgi:hypothetical protein
VAHATKIGAGLGSREQLCARLGVGVTQPLLAIALAINLNIAIPAAEFPAAIIVTPERFGWRQLVNIGFVRYPPVRSKAARKCMRDNTNYRRK